jgi:hypothetical protein
MKYICFQRDDIELALLFPELIQHREAAKALQPSDRILGAGFCKSNHDHVHAWGQSDGLKLSSRGELDAVAILFTINLPVLEPAEAA